MVLKCQLLKIFHGMDNFEYSKSHKFLFTVPNIRLSLECFLVHILVVHILWCYFEVNLWFLFQTPGWWELFIYHHTYVVIVCICKRKFTWETCFLKINKDGGHSHRKGWPLPKMGIVSWLLIIWLDPEWRTFIDLCPVSPIIVPMSTNALGSLVIVCW